MKDLTKYPITMRRDREWEQRMLNSQWEPFDPRTSGCFRVWNNQRELACIVTNGGGWDHVSVQLATILGLPTWWDLEFVRKFFFEPNEVVVQYHVPEKDHVNVHGRVLHLWRPHGIPLPMPPKEYV